MIGYIKRSAVLIAVLFAIFPIFWLVSTSFKSYNEWQTWPPVWIPHTPTLQNYRTLFAPKAAQAIAAKQKGNLSYKVSGSAWHAFRDSAIIATLATLLSLLFGLLAAYSIVRFNTGGDTYPFQFLLVRMFPPIAVVVPVLVVYSAFNLTDSILGMVVAYTAFTLPFSIWMLRSFIEDVPEDLESAAMLNGLTQFQAFKKVTLPLIKGGILATALFIFILNWSEFLFALVLTGGQVITVTVQVANYVSASSGKLYGIQAAMGTISTLPVICLSYLIQKHLVRGLTLGAVKR